MPTAHARTARPAAHGRAARPLDDRPRELALARDLWRRQQEYVASRGEVGAVMDYLAAHLGNPVTLERHLRVLDLFRDHIRGRVLEWGCQHGLDSCLFRLRHGDAVELHGCDIVPPEAYTPFRDFSGMSYTRIDHPYRLDYPDGHFDVATSNGVLEHVPDDARSLGELHRVLRPGGTLVVTCLPNRWSYTEAVQRLRGRPAHDRLYTIASASRLLRAAGFLVREVRYLFVLPTMLLGCPPGLRARYERAAPLVWAANSVLERLWPASRLASNLMLVARKPGAA